MYIWGHEVQHGLSAVISPKKKRKLLNKPYSKGKKDEQASIHMHVYSYLSITTLPFPAYNGPKVLLSVDSASIYTYLFWPHQCKRIPLLHLASYGYLFPCQYVTTWPLPPLLPASTHAVPTRCSEKAKGKETVMYRLSPPHCLSHKGQEHRTQPDYSSRERCTSKKHCSYYYSNSRVSTEALSSP